MRNSGLTSFYLFVISVLLFSCVFPFSQISSSSKIAPNHLSEINSYWESERTNLYSQNTKILCLKWNDIDFLLETGKSYQIFDIKTKEYFYLKRVGGKNHADMIASSQEDLLTIKKLYGFNAPYNPVLVKINDQSFLPASFNAWQHGYNSHFCLHFYSSKTDGTKMIDQKHQKAISIAQKAKLPE